MRALIVEDEESMAMILSAWLKGLGYEEIIVTGSIAAAASIIEKTPSIEVITLDLNLTDSRAEQTIEKIATIRAVNPNALLLVISGVLTSADEKRITALGADGFMEKHDIATEKSFFGKLKDVVGSLAKTPTQYSRNLPLLEALAASVAKRCDELQCSIGGTPPENNVQENNLRGSYSESERETGASEGDGKETRET